MPDYHLYDSVQKKIRLGAWISTQKEADEAIAYINALKEFLPGGASSEPKSHQNPGIKDDAEEN